MFQHVIFLLLNVLLGWKHWGCETVSNARSAACVFLYLYQLKATLQPRFVYQL